MTGQTIGLLLVMIIYLILMVGIGVLYSKKNNDVSDFYLGGICFPPYPSVIFPVSLFWTGVPYPA